MAVSYWKCGGGDARDAHSALHNAHLRQLRALCTAQPRRRRACERVFSNFNPEPRDIGQRDHARQLHAACLVGRRREHVELLILCNQTPNISISMRHKIEHWTCGSLFWTLSVHKWGPGLMQSKIYIIYYDKNDSLSQIIFPNLPIWSSSSSLFYLLITLMAAELSSALS